MISPLSIAYAFAMARAGARGDTADQIDAVLRYLPDGVHAAFNAITRELVTESGHPPGHRLRRPEHPAGSGPPVLSAPTGCSCRRASDLQDEFLRILAAQYGAGAQALAFPCHRKRSRSTTPGSASGPPDRIRKLFENWTHGTKVVLANAVYFQADWALPFAGTPATTASFAPERRQHRPSSDDAARGRSGTRPCRQLAGGRTALRRQDRHGVLVPTDQTSPAVVSPGHIHRRGGWAGPGPGWTCRCLSGTSPTTWTSSRRCGSGAWRSRSNRVRTSSFFPGVWIDQAVHRANITVDEWGTEAAAVIGLGFDESAPPPRPD